MNEDDLLNPVTEHISGGATLNAENDIEIGGDVVGRDKIESATGNIIHVEPGATVVVNDVPTPSPFYWTGWMLRVFPAIGLVVMITGVFFVALRPTSSVQAADMVYIPAGSFTMGSDLPDAPADAQPAHTVDLDAFWIDRDEVTNQEYKVFLDATEHRLPQAWNGKYPAGRDDMPVAGVSWADAAAYCSSVGKRLPTEAEWEKAARGTDGRTWPWGNEWDAARANAEAQDGTAFRPVGTYPNGASPYGVLNMAGEVWEWVQDWYAAQYYTLKVLRNPSGPGLGDFKVARGGSLIDARALVRTFARLGIYPPDFPGIDVGVRCACTDCRK